MKGLLTRMGGQIIQMNKLADRVKSITDTEAKIIDEMSDG